MMHFFDKDLFDLMFDYPATLDVEVWDNSPDINFDATVNCTISANSMACALPEIRNVVFNDPATVVFWEDGTKSVVKCQKCDTYSKEAGLAMAIAKKAYGNKGSFNDIFSKWIKE